MPFSSLFTSEVGGRVVLHAMPLLLLVLCVLAIAYRFYSAFLAARVATLNDLRRTPAHEFNDGQNYHPTNRWVLFGHHFAAISGAGPLIGPVLAIQYGYMPGLLWLVIGVCLAGAVQDMLVLAASVRRGGKSLAQIALTELGRPAAIIVSVSIIFIVIIALAGLGFVVVKALGGEEAKLLDTMEIRTREPITQETKDGRLLVNFPKNSEIRDDPGSEFVSLPESFTVAGKADKSKLAAPIAQDEHGALYRVGPDHVRLVPGSSWGTFTIAATIPIALLVSLWMYRIRKGKVVEASALGAIGVLAATVAGGAIPGSPLEPIFSLSRNGTIVALCVYGFTASVLPVWLLLCPRDYISSFLKIGTIALLVLGVIVANPVMPSPMFNQTFASGGPTFPGSVFPFVFICIMCGAISGFHALVSSGTTPKMVDKESDVRLIGYGSMLIEGLVGVVALIAAASLPVDLYYDINIDIEKAPAFREQLKEIYREYQTTPHLVKARDLHDLKVEDANLAEMQHLVGGESLRGRTGGAVTLAVGMARILTQAMHKINLEFEGLVKYWFHFAIMFEALFILTTIDTGTRIARFLMQETLGQVFPRFAQTDWLPGSILATGVVTVGWGGLVSTGSIETIWPMFGIANQLLAALALCLVTTMLINSGRGRYAPITLVPMLFVCSTTLTAGGVMTARFAAMMQTPGREFAGAMNLGLTLFVIVSVCAVLLIAVARWVGVTMGKVAVRREETTSVG